MALMPRPPLLVCAFLLAAGLGSAAPAAFAASGRPERPASRARAESALLRAEKLLAGQGVRSGREVTLALARLARHQNALPASDRERARGLLARPTDGSSDPEGHGYTAGEHPPYCVVHFCVHFVTSTADAPALTDSDADGFPNYVENMAGQFEFVHSLEHGSEAAGGLAWTTPKSDGSRGGNGKTDVYIAQIGDEGLFGYAAPEQGSVSSYAYLVMDDDYAEFAPLAPLAALQVTAAHEYNHVLQFTYDSHEDPWMLEATAVWAEEQVYPAVNDYLNYVNAWAGCTAAPLTAADPPGATCDLKMYGDGVWSHWLGSRYGRDVIRRAWELSDVTTPQPHFAPDAYGESIATEGGAGFGDEFGRFAAAVAEWRTPVSLFPDHASYPDVSRTGTPLTVNGGARTVTLDHTTFALIDVRPDATRPAIEFQANAPAGVDSTIALVGRTGPDPAAGTVAIATKRLPGGGTGSVAMQAPGSFGRITAVLANADFSQAGFAGDDWIWSRNGQAFQNVQVVPAAAAVARAARLKLTSRLALRSPQRLRTALRRGVLARVRCNQACRVRVGLRLGRRTARRLHLKRVVGARVVILKRAGVKSFRVRIGRRARLELRGRERVHLTARMRASRGSARAALLSRRVTLKR
jgi:hypothetical protein